MLQLKRAEAAIQYVEELLESKRRHAAERLNHNNKEEFVAGRIDSEANMLALVIELAKLGLVMCETVGGSDDKHEQAKK